MERSLRRLGDRKHSLQLAPQEPKVDPTAKERCAKANKTVIRYVVYWTLGIVALLAIDMCRQGIIPVNWIPMAVAVPILLAFGIAYLRTTTSKERQRDAIRKLTDRTYE